MKCKKCGEKVAKGQIYCTKCGTLVRRKKWPFIATGVVAAVVIALALLLASGSVEILGISISSESSSEDLINYENAQAAYLDIEAVSQEGYEIEEKYADDEGYVDSRKVPDLLAEVEKHFENDSRVSDVDNNGQTITLTLSQNGGEVVFEPRLKGAASGGDTCEVVTCEPYLRNDFHFDWDTFSIENTKRAPMTADGKSLIDDTASYVSSKLTKYSFDEANNYDNCDVSPRMFQGLHNHELVILNGHGGISGDTVFIGTGVCVETLNPYIDTGIFAKVIRIKNPDFDSQYYSDWCERLIAPSTNGYLLVKPAYFQKTEYFPHDCFDGTIFFLGTCDTLKSDSLAKALIDRGAKLVVGSTDIISSDYVASMISTMLHHMSEFDDESGNYPTVSEALAFAENINNIEGTGFDAYDGRVNFYPEGGSSIRLAEAESVKAATTADDNSGSGSGTTTVSSTTDREIAMVLDVSGSMAGEPLEATKDAAEQFVSVALQNNAETALVAFDDEASVLSKFSSKESYLKSAIAQLTDAGGTNIEDGLAKADGLLDGKSDDSKKYVVLMSDGDPNDGKTGDDLISYAQSIRDPDGDGRDDVIIYALGFNESSSGELLLRKIASEGCYYSVQETSDLQDFFQDMVDSINGVKFMYARVACPVDVSVTLNGETLSSAGDNPSTRTSFGSLTFEQNDDVDDSEGTASGYTTNDNLVKVLRLREGESYDVSIVGTGEGSMDYSLGLVDDDGVYSDFRTFSDIGITDQTSIETTAEASATTTLKVDSDSDGKIDAAYRAGANEEGQLVDNSWIAYIVVIAIFAVVLVTLLAIVLIKLARRRKGSAAGR